MIHSFFFFLDLIALPDFQSKEISHFGLISFRESNLLFHPDENSAVDKQRVAHSVSNGLAGLVSHFSYYLN